MKIKNLIISAMLLAGSLNAAELQVNKLNAQSMAKLEFVKKYAHSPNMIMEIQKIGYPYQVKNNQLFVNLLIKVSSAEADAQLKKLDCKITAKAGTVYAIVAPADKIAEVSEISAVQTIEVSKTYKINMDKSKKAINADQVTVNNNITPNNIIAGEGVIVGIVDTGIDITHPDFSNENGTRVLKLWDMSEKTDAEGPEGYESYYWGKEYDKETIDADINAVDERDYHGHGTHVAGTAAGGGKADPNFRGIAYNSDLIIVKGVMDDDDGDFPDASIIAGCDYIIKEAKKLNRPVIINLSLGGMIGSHDGQDLISLAISQLSGPGVVFSIAAGNEGELPMHSGGAVEANQLVELPIYPQNICEIFEKVSELCKLDNAYLTLGDVWYSKDLVETVYLNAYDIQSLMTGIPKIVVQKTFPVGIAIENEPILNNSGVPVAYFSYNSTTTDYPSNHSGNLGFYIHNNADPNVDISRNIWSIVVKTKNAGTIDMWAGIPLPAQFPFQPIVGDIAFQADGQMTVGSPGDADSAICVGSFVTKSSWVDTDGVTQNNDWEIGDISSFSSRGPSRDGRILPLITAPGQVIFSSKSKDYHADNADIMAGGLYVGMSGTSMATPHLTGAIALMLQANPKLGYSEIVNILENTAVRDEYTGDLRNNTFGLGKIDVQASINYILEISGVEYIYANEVKVYPNPAVNSINFQLNDKIEVSNFAISIYNSLGEIIPVKSNYQISGTNLNLDISNFASGVYNAECRSGNSISKFRFVVK